MYMFSVLILVKNRPDHLANVIAGLEQSTLQPGEIVVVHMNEEPYNISSRVPLHSHKLISSSSLPLAEARNKAASLAMYDQLLFLDVDCIPAADTCAQLLESLDNYGLVMAQPKYLSQKLSQPEAVQLEQLADMAEPAKSRSHLSHGPNTDYTMFWTLGFAIKRQDFNTIGGFDETYTGYGAEDTDFAYMARDKGVSLFYSSAVVYHQYHSSYMPPLNHLQDIVQNSQTFYAKWNEWPMTGWLHAFEKDGYISMHDGRIDILRLPSQSEIDSCLVR
jgi:GT2 family glycosyltransferase